MTALPPKKKCSLLNQEGKIAATLIDRTLAEARLSERKKGAVKLIEGDLI
jgi:hypothetical protein